MLLRLELLFQANFKALQKVLGPSHQSFNLIFDRIIDAQNFFSHFFHPDFYGFNLKLVAPGFFVRKFYGVLKSNPILVVNFYFLDRIDGVRTLTLLDLLHLRFQDDHVWLDLRKFLDNFLFAEILLRESGLKLEYLVIIVILLFPNLVDLFFSVVKFS